ncbi:MAG: alkaline phosphatase family protein, partial [Gluconacetobacter diazotrophicus]|nr:alkaline phosphatase family protein [Gluconacetobacter diazotrophicus]
MTRTAVLNVVGLTPRLLDSGHLPRLAAFALGGVRAAVRPAFPAVTCTAQATYLTGLPPAGHGVVGNGWYDRALAEVHFWKQSNRLVAGRKLWEDLRETRPGFTCANLFWWFNMYSTVDFSVTPRPIYRADGAKIFDVASHPPALRPALKRDLGEFPFPAFWGPRAGIASSRWIAEAARWTEEHHAPDLQLVYLPHLDYNFQRLGPDDPAIAADLRAIDDVAADLITTLEARGVEVVVLSEYGITAVDRPVYLNRLFRERGWIAWRDELGTEAFDAGACPAFAVADHQVAHVYVNDPAILGDVRAAVEGQPGVAEVLDAAAQEARGVRHARGGDFLAVADARSWFAYYYWLDDARAPDFARTIEIHRKPGYDPAELFVDPRLRWPAGRVAGFLLKKRLGLRALLDVIPLDATLVRGSHGRVPDDPADGPVLLARRTPPGFGPSLEATEVYG